MKEREAKTWSSELQVGDTVKTADGMLHRVESIDLFVTIKPLGDTAATPISFASEHVTRWEPGE